MLFWPGKYSLIVYKEDDTRLMESRKRISWLAVPRTLEIMQASGRRWKILRWEKVVAEG